MPAVVELTTQNSHRWDLGCKHASLLAEPDHLLDRCAPQNSEATSCCV